MNNDFKLLFISINEFEGGKVIRGAALVTDKETKPLEFRCTSPIRPSNIQKILYGDTLNQHIKIELIAKSLLGAIKQKPTVVLVRDSSLLEARRETETILVRICKNEEVDTALTGDSEEKNTMLLTSDSGKFEPVVIEAHKEFQADRQKARELLHEVFSRYSLLEPFERMSVALEQVHKQQAKAE